MTALFLQFFLYLIKCHFGHTHYTTYTNESFSKLQLRLIKDCSVSFGEFIQPGAIGARGLPCSVFILFPESVISLQS